ncbi:AraC family transcriptional regulator [Roseibium sediminis]|uniref:AraC family transcriptional regulator n=1 Tax=Roseibium sediminis TaxID=1775174 RepID=UPI00123CF58A|nr:AraC family transcriptional regulator [Roseibium sediminis]
MPKPGPAYIRRFERVIDHIADNLDRKLDLNSLAEIAALSPWHWHRIWQSTFGESVIGTVKRMRLYRAATDLGHTDMSLDRVAKRAGYGSQAAFNRSFRQMFEETPAVFRERHRHKVIRRTELSSMLANPSGEANMYDVEIRHIPSETLAGIHHTGAYTGISKSFEQLFGYLAFNDLFEKCGAVKGLYFSDPTSVAEKDLKSMAGVVVRDEFPFAAPLERHETRGGDYAVLTHKGPYSELASAYQWLYSAWITSSDREPDDAPAMEIYLNNPRDVAPADLLTEICMPLK